MRLGLLFWRFPIRRTVDNSGQNNSGHQGVLSQVAQHERELLAKVQEAEAAAQRTVDSARQEADRIATGAEKALNDEIDSMRRASEDKRAIERESIMKATQQEVAAARSKAEAHLDVAAKEVVELILPGGNS
jgi:vacuolar-type H+-ATPase subunit H